MIPLSRDGHTLWRTPHATFANRHVDVGYVTKIDHDIYTMAVKYNVALSGLNSKWLVPEQSKALIGCPG